MLSDEGMWCVQYLDLDRTYVRWQQVHGDSDDDEESDVSSDEEVEGVSELGEICCWPTLQLHVIRYSKAK